MWKSLMVVPVLGLFMVCPAMAVGANNALFVWGTLSDLPAGSEGKISTTDNTNLIFEFKRYKLVVPYSRITVLEHGYHAGRRVNLEAAVRIAMTARASRSFLTISYSDPADVEQVAVFEFGSRIATAVLNDLARRTSRKIERQGEPDLSEVSRQKGTREREANALFARAEWLLSVEQWDTAIAALDRLLASEPNMAEALQLRGQAKHNAGRPPAESLADLDGGMKQRPSARAFLLRALVRHSAGLSKEALEDCDQAIRYADARGFDPAVMESLKAGGRSVEINIGGGFDQAYEAQKEEAIRLRYRILVEMKK